MTLLRLSKCFILIKADRLSENIGILMSNLSCPAIKTEHRPPVASDYKLCTQTCKKPKLNHPHHGIMLINTTVMMELNLNTSANSVISVSALTKELLLTSRDTCK